MGCVTDWNNLRIYYLIDFQSENLLFYTENNKSEIFYQKCVWCIYE